LSDYISSTNYNHCTRPGNTAKTKTVLVFMEFILVGLYIVAPKVHFTQVKMIRSDVKYVYYFESSIYDIFFNVT
jgi:hypothetical protein